METLVEAKAADGSLDAEDIASFVNEVQTTVDPKERTRKARALRRAIRRADHMERSDRREAVRALKRALRAAAADPTRVRVDDGIDPAAVLTEVRAANEIVEAKSKRTVGIEAPPGPGLGARSLGSFRGF